MTSARIGGAGVCVPEAATVGEGSLLQVEGMRQKMVSSVPGRKQGLCVRVHIRGSRGGRKPHRYPVSGSPGAAIFYFFCGSETLQPSLQV